MTKGVYDESNDLYYTPENFTLIELVEGEAFIKIGGNYFNFNDLEEIILELKAFQKQLNAGK